MLWLKNTKGWLTNLPEKQGYKKRAEPGVDKPQTPEGAFPNFLEYHTFSGKFIFPFMC